MYKKLLVPLDGSTLAEAALSHAERIAQQFDSEIVLLRVIVSPYTIVAPDLVLAGTELNLPQLDAQARQYLQEVAGRLEQNGLTVRTEVCEVPVADASLDYAQTLDIEMIVMSTHGRSGVSRWVYGSVAERVLQGASCPILLLRTQDSS